MNPILGNIKCIYFLLTRGREERKLPLWVQTSKHLGLKAGRGQACPFPSGRPLGQLCDIEKPVQSFCSESISNQVSALPSFSGTFYLEILDLCKGLHSSLSQCWFHCGFSCWEILLMIFLFPNVRAKSGQNICFKSCLKAELPACSLGFLWKLQPFHLCHRSQLSHLLPRSLLGSVPDLSLALPPDSSPGRPRMRRAQLKGSQWISFGLKEAFGDFFFFQAAYHLRISIPRWYQIVAVSETTEVARVRRSLSKAKQYQVVVLCQNVLGPDCI